MPDLSPLAFAVVALAVLVASGVHAALGFGSGPIVAPVLLAVLAEPAEGVAATLVVALALNALVLRDEGRGALRALGGERPLWAGAPLGAAAGALAAGATRPAVLGALLAALLVLAALAALAQRPLVRLPGAPAGRVALGAALGASAATTGVVGPFIAVLLAPVVPGGRLRGAIAATFLVVSVVALAAHGVVAGPDAVARGGLLVLLVAPAGAVGVLAGRRALAHLPHGRRRRLSLAVAASSALLALLVAAL